MRRGQHIASWMNSAGINLPPSCENCNGALAQVMHASGPEGIPDACLDILGRVRRAADVYVASQRSGFIRDHDRQTAGSAELPRTATSRPQLRVGRRLLVPAGKTLQVARRLLDTSAICRRLLGESVLQRRAVLPGLLGRWPPLREPRPPVG